MAVWELSPSAGRIHHCLPAIRTPSLGEEKTFYNCESWWEKSCICISVHTRHAPAAEPDSNLDPLTPRERLPVYDENNGLFNKHSLLRCRPLYSNISEDWVNLRPLTPSCKAEPHQGVKHLLTLWPLSELLKHKDLCMETKGCSVIFHCRMGSLARP